ncbi:MAG: respiratory nitrate reductase subunit gamma [Hydrogenophilus sp.]|nr:respiratory nitrate reductase subunit gamma [Hydrogenophilus sp.]
MLVLFYVASAVFVVGLVLKLVQYGRTPAPLKIPTTPAPATRGGVIWRLVKEVTVFESLFKGDLLLWLFAILFHGGLLLVTVRHLRYFLDPVPEVIVWLQPFGIYGGMAMVVGLLGLWGRRLLIARVRYISTVSDHLWLLLLLVLAGSGLLMTFVTHPDVVAVKAFVRGAITFSPEPFPSDLMVALHLLAFFVLLVLFPFSKLLHAPGLFFSPTRNQADDPRERRHLASWAAALEREKAGAEER